MASALVAAATDEGFRLGLVVTTMGFGLRHGVDWDHIAAITDITSSQDRPRRSMLLATLYAVGHATVVLVLGGAAVLAGDLLPSAVDRAMERVVGATLVLLGVYVFYSLLRHGRNFQLRSRWMLLISLGARLRHRLGRTKTVEIVHEHDHGPDHGHDHPHDLAPDVDEPLASVAVVTRHRHLHRHRAPLPRDPFATYSSWTAYLVGMLHGVGAETATQVLVFVAAANAGGPVAGIVLLVVFVAGLVVSNTGIALASTVGFLRAGQSYRVYATIGVTTGLFSLVVGTLFLVGQSGMLPPILGG